MQDQHRQHRALLGAGQRHHTTVGAHLQRPEDAEFHRSLKLTLLRPAAPVSACNPRASVPQAAGRAGPTMTTQLTPPPRPTTDTHGSVGRRNLRNAAAIAGAAALIATGASTAGATGAVTGA